MKVVTQVILIAMFVIGAFAGEKPSQFKRLFSKEKKEPSYYYDSRKDDYPTYKKPGQDDKRSDYYDSYPSEPYVPYAYNGYQSEFYDAWPARRQVVMEFTGNLKLYGSGRRRSRLLSSMTNRDFYY